MIPSRPVASKPTLAEVIDIVSSNRHKTDDVANNRVSEFIKENKMAEYATKEGALNKNKASSFLKALQEMKNVKIQAQSVPPPRNREADILDTPISASVSQQSASDGAYDFPTPSKSTKGFLDGLDRSDYPRINSSQTVLAEQYMKDGLINSDKYQPQLVQYYKGGPKFPFYQTNVGGSIADTFGSNKNLLKKITADYFKPSHLSAFPSYIYNPERTSARAKDQYRSLFTKQRTNQNSVLLSDLSKKYDTVKWNPIDKYWQVPTVITQAFRPRDQKMWRKNAVWGNFFLSKKLSQEQILKYVPPLVGQLIKSNANFSKGGIGPLSSKSLPFYAGRFLDINTGRIRTLPKASNKYLDPISYDAKMSYLQARLLNKWNEYVLSQQQILNFSAYDKETWEKSAKQKLVKGLTTDFKGSSINAMKKWYLGQIQLYQVGAPLSATSKIVLSTMPKYPTQWQAFAKSLNVQETTTPDTNQLVDIMNKQLARLNGTSMKEVKQRNQITFSFGVWLNKGKWSRRSAITKLFKTMIPQNISQQDLMKINQWRIKNPNVFNKTGTLQITKAQIQDVFKKKPKNIQQFQNTVNKYVGNIGGNKLAITSAPYNQQLKKPTIYPTQIRPKTLI